MPKSPGRAYGVAQGNTKFLKGDFHINSAEDSITATAGGGQANAYQINSQVSRVSTVATAADSVQLPVAYEGMWVILLNDAANSMQVYGQVLGVANAGDTINGIATATGVPQMGKSACIYFCPTDGKWITIGAGEGYSPQSGIPTQSFAAIAANSTGTQASGTKVTALINTVSSAGSAYSVTLPVSAPGMSIQIISTDPTNTVAVFPNAGGTTTEKINALSANAGITMGAATSATFDCVVAGQWWTNPRVPS